MDADVEMVDRRRGGDDEEVGPAEDLYSVTVTESRLHSQNRWFTVSMVLCLVVMLFWIGGVYQKEDIIEQISNSGDSGEIPEGLDNSAVAEGAAQLKPHKHGKHTHNHTTTANPPSSPSEPPPPSKSPVQAPVAIPTTASPTSAPTKSPVVTAAVTTSPTVNSNDSSPSGGASDVQAWLDASVTLDDGIKYEVVQQLTHDKASFTEGLTYCDSQLYESVGMRRRSALLVLDTETGDTLETYSMDTQYFGEGLTCVGDRLIQLTYTHNTGFVYNRTDLSKTPSTFHFDTTTGEGWGLTYDADRHELIVSDGSEFLHFWDPDTLEFKRKTAVTRLNGAKANNINELEYWRGRVIANVWFHDFLLVIDPESGMVEKEYDFTELWSSQERTIQGADVLNGISVSEDPNFLYLTGKYWDRMFLVRLIY